MYSISFPKMVTNTHTILVQDHEATYQNLRLMLLSAKNTLLGDPYFGTNLKKLTFEQNNQVLRDLVIDDIYTSVLTFIPQLVLKRSDITITSDRYKVYAKIKATNLIDYQLNTYNINLTQYEEV